MRKLSLPALAIRRPVTVIMLTVTVMGFGVISATRTPVEFMPPMDLPFLGAYIPYPGNTPAQVEQEIAIPAEGEFRTLPNLENMFSHSDSNGCFISLEFEMGTPMSTALAEVRDRMERLRLVLPDEIDHIWMRHFKLESLPVMQFVLSSTEDYEDFAARVDTEFLPRIQRLEGVAEVEVFGWEQRDLAVEIDQEALLSRNISLYEVISTIAAGDVDMGLGTLNDGRRKYMVRAESKLDTIEAYQKLPLREGIQLGEVAKGNLKESEERSHFSIDGERQIFMIVTKESEANTVSTCKNVMAELEAIQADAEDGHTIQKFVFFNQGEIITGALNGLRKSSIYGGIMALIVLFLFLRRVPPTVIVALAIPGSLVAAFVFLLAAGMSLNIITMMSLIIAVGMVVDNAIVVIENIYRYQGMGFDRLEAAEKGAGEVSLAIVAATSTTAVVFLPVFYIDGGEMSTFMRHFAIPVTVALGASLLLALTVIPLAVSRIKTNVKVAAQTPFERADEDAERTRWRFLSFPYMFRSGYGRMMDLSMRHRLASMLVLAAIIAITVKLPMSKMQFQQMPQNDDRRVVVTLDMDVNYDFDKATEVVDAIEQAIMPFHDELGIKHHFKDYGSRRAELTFALLKDSDMASDFEEFPYSTEEVLDIIWYLIPQNLPGVEVSVGTDGGQRGGGSAQSRVSVRLDGDDTQTLDTYAKRFQQLVEELPNITNTRISSQRASQEIQLNIDEELASYMQIDPSQIAQTVAFALRGTQLSKQRQGAREVTVWAQFEKEDRENTNNLDNIMMAGKDGKMVTLNQLVEKRKANTPRTIQRRNGKNFVYVTGNVGGGKDLMGIRESLQELMTGFQMPTGYSIRMGDEFKGIEENQTNFLSLLLMAVILIFIVMSALFESCLLPLSILTTVPLAFLGVSWIMYLTGTPMDTIAFIGCILMVGVVVNNGIVIVDHINQLRKEGLSRHEAIVQGGKNRLRPVLMTALTTILGAIPLAIGGRIGEPATVSLGMAMIGGLTAGTFLTLVVVPLFYSFIDDIQEWIKHFIAELTDLQKPAAP